MKSVVCNAGPEGAGGDEADVVVEADPAEIAAAQRQILA
jgi:hypothetical protein